MKTKEQYELHEYLTNLNNALNKIDINDIKIDDLYFLNILNQLISVNFSLNSKLYDFYFKNNIKWLLENKERIIEDFKSIALENKFNIILNTNLELKNIFINNIDSFDEFIKYLDYLPKEYLNKRKLKELTKQYEYFKSLKEYDQLMYFERIKRR